MNPFRNFSIKIRLFATFILVALLPSSVFLYIHIMGITIDATTAILIVALSLLIALVTAFLVTASIAVPVSRIFHALQKYKVKKSTVAINDDNFDELGKISSDLSEILSDSASKVLNLSKQQFYQEKINEKSEYRLSLLEKQLLLSRSCLKIAQELNTTFDFQANLKTILDEAVKTLEIQWASVLLINKENLEMTVACVRGVEQSLLDDLVESEYPSIRLRPHEGLAGYVIKEELPLIANKGHKDPRFKTFSEFREKDEKVASILCCPIKGSDGEILGVANFVNRINPPVFRNEDIPYTEDLCRLVSLVVERNRLYKNLFKDGKTGLSAYNVWRGFFSEESARAVRYAQPLSLVILDIDGFKEITSSTNTDFANEVTVSTGKIINDALRDTDLGSNVQDRFYLILPSTDTAGAVFFVGRIKESIEKQKFEFDSKEITVTLSAGIANYPDSDNDARNLPKLALKALNDAKNQGHNRATVYNPSK